MNIRPNSLALSFYQSGFNRRKIVEAAAAMGQHNYPESSHAFQLARAIVKQYDRIAARQSPVDKPNPRSQERISRIIKKIS